MLPWVQRHPPGAPLSKTSWDSGCAHGHNPAYGCRVTVGLAAAGALPNLVHRPGSLICHGDVVFQHPGPTSLEVLEALVLSVGPNKTLAGSDFQVDPYSLAVGGKLPIWGTSIQVSSACGSMPTVRAE